jgi:DNA invertase Pin-like site-specific DNA recombinase
MALLQEARSRTRKSRPASSGPSPRGVVKLGRPKIDSAIERKVRKQLAKGVGILKVARSLGIGTGTVHRISNELR